MAGMRMTKAQYDELYYYVTGSALKLIENDGRDPLKLSSPRRYDTLDNVRKAALAKSKKEADLIKEGIAPRYRSLTVGVYKGRKYLGFVEYATSRPRGSAHVGFWHPVGRTKDPIPLYKDGSTSPSKPKASKPKATPKKSASGTTPATLVAVVDGRFAPVNGFRYPKAEVKALVKSMDSVYARMYDGELDDTQWVHVGDEMLSRNKRLVAAVACERQDLLTSDREVAAFAYAVYHSKNRDKLLAMDRPSAPKSAGKRRL